MKFLKVLGLAAVAAAALMAFVGAQTASATVLCKVQGTGATTGTTCPEGEAYSSGQEIHAVLDPGTKATLKTEFKTIECTESTVKGSTSAEVEETLSGPEGTLTFGGCNCTVTVLKAGTVSITWISGTHNATLKSNGSESTVSCSTIFGTVHCIYVTENTDLGTLTGGNPATLDANAEIPRLATSALCSAKALWEAKYEVTTPKPLYVAENAAGVVCIELNKNEGDFTSDADCTATRNLEPNQGTWERTIP